jgi:hypothetical protein
MPKASSSDTSFNTISMPMALPIARLLASPRRSEATSSPCATAFVATVANAPNTSAHSTDRSSKALALSEKRLSAPARARSTGSRTLSAPRTGVSASTRFANDGHRLSVVRSV